VDGQEFARILRSLNIEETSRRVEVVRKVISGALDRQAKDCHAAVALLNFLVNNEDLKQTDINVALRQLHDRLPDLTLDVPDAAPILETFASKLQVSGFLGARLVEGSPSVEDVWRMDRDTPRFQIFLRPFLSLFCASRRVHCPCRFRASHRCVSLRLFPQMVGSPCTEGG